MSIFIIWLATSLRMCGASDARIQAMGRWLNPESIKIYARMTKEEYAEWVDKMLTVRRIDTARTTNLPIMDAAEAFAQWGVNLDAPSRTPADLMTIPDRSEPPVAPPPLTLKRGERVEVFWTDMNQWFAGTFKTSRVEPADGGGTQRASCVVYDAAGVWAHSSVKQLTYWHCLDDEQWHRIAT